MALLIYAIILCQRRHQGKVTTMHQNARKVKIATENPSKSGRHLLDELSMVFFPVAFAIFTGVYIVLKSKDDDRYSYTI